MNANWKTFFKRIVYDSLKVLLLFFHKKAKKNSETQIGEIKIYGLAFIIFINVW